MTSILPDGSDSKADCPHAAQHHLMESCGSCDYRHASTPEDDWGDAPHRVDSVQFTHRGKHFYQVTITTDAHRVVVSVSPQGRSVRVWLDGIPMQEEPVELARHIARTADAR